MNPIVSILESFAALFKSFFVVFNKPKVGVNHPNSYINKSTGKPKIPYSRSMANNEAVERTLQTGEVHGPYKSPISENYHIGHSNKKGPAFVLIIYSLALLIAGLIGLFKKRNDFNEYL